MALGDSDLPVFFADFGEPAVINGQAVKVFVDTPANPFEHGGLGSMEQGCTRITAPITALTALPIPGQAVTVRGCSYTVKSRTPVGDGRIVEIELKATS